MVGSTRPSSEGSRISARTPRLRCRASAFSSDARMAALTPMRAPERMKPDWPATASPKRSKTARERSTIWVVSGVG